MKQLTVQRIKTTQYDYAYADNTLQVSNFTPDKIGDKATEDDGQILSRGQYTTGQVLIANGHQVLRHASQ